MTIRHWWALAGAVTLTACGGGTPPPATVSARPASYPVSVGLAAVMGHDAGQLTRLFGQPNADVREGVGRKLQYVGPICVLDAYLYPQGAAQPVVTWIDARQGDGSPIDKASCVAALKRSGVR